MNPNPTRVSLSSDSVSEVTLPTSLQSEPAEPTAVDVPQYVQRKSGGGRKGDTVAAREEKTKLVRAANSEAAVRFEDVKLTTSGQLKAGILKEICVKAAVDRGLPPDTVKPETIRKRVKRQNLHGVNPANTSPTLPVEPVIVDFCTKMAMIGLPYNRDKVIAFAQGIICRQWRR